MDLLNIVKKNVVPTYVDGEDDAAEERVSKRVKTFHQQVQKGVSEMEGMLEYEPGRKYVKYHMQKGKSKRGKLYVRETRNEALVPDTRRKLEKFIKDQNKELRYFIKETTENVQVETDEEIEAF